MTMWIFAGITLVACGMSTFMTDFRRVILSLWVAGLGVGGIYLTVGAEFLAIVQWIVSTLVAISFSFFSVMFGEYGRKDDTSWKKRAFQAGTALIPGIGFMFMVWLGVRGMAGELNGSEFVKQGNDLVTLGKSLTRDHLLSLEVLALTLFLVLVGSGVIARPERRDE